VLVAGATEIGVEINKKFKTFPVLISTEGVAELTPEIVETPQVWRIGAGATLTAIEEKVASGVSVAREDAAGVCAPDRFGIARRWAGISRRRRRSATARRC
jgi:hypothetical protein